MPYSLYIYQRQRILTESARARTHDRYRMRLQDYGGEATASVAASLAVLGGAWAPTTAPLVGSVDAAGGELPVSQRGVGMVEATELAQALVDLEVRPEV